MKKIFYALSLAVALLTTSCTKDATEDILNGGNNGDNQVAMTTITVGIDNNQTRIHLGEEEDGYMPLYWSKGDVVYTNVYNTTASASDPISAEDDGSEVATLKVAEGSTEVFVGVQQSLTKKGYIYIPSEQTYDSTKFANGHAIMLGAIDTKTNTATLKHVCGYLKVSLTGSATVKKVMLRAIGHEPISGYHKYTLGETTTIYDYDNIGVADGYYTSPVITINCGEGVALSGEATDFYFAIPEGNYSKGFALTVLDSNNKQHTVAAYKNNGKDIFAGVMTKMQTLTVNCTNDAGIYDVNQFMGFARTHEKDCWIDNNNTITLRSDFDLKDESVANLRSLIYLRDNYETYNNSDMESLKGVKADDSKVVISNFNISSSSNSGLLFYQIPSTLTVENIQLGHTADNPTTPNNEADCTLTISTKNSTSYQYVGAFCCIIEGTINNCVNYATTDVTILNKGILIGSFSSGSSGSTGNLTNCVNYGYTKLTDNTGAKKANNWVGGIAARVYGTLSDCTNNGAINITSATPTTYVGGVIGQSSVTSFTNLKNTGNIDVTMTDANALTYLGGVCGDVNEASTAFTNCDNSGNINVTSTTSTSTSWSYIGGIVGRSASNATHRNHDNTGDITVNFSGKCRVGGIGGYASKATTCTVKETTITVTNAGADSNIGGYTGYSNNTAKTGCEVDVTINNSASNVLVGGLAGCVNGTTWTNCYLKANITSTGENTQTGLVTTKAVGAGYTLTLGAEDKPFKISTGSVFNGINVSESTVVDSVTEGKANLYVHEAGNYELALSKINVQFVD
ncbi:MAG: hypothetical protein IJZ67_04740 [Alistipes sp.]|nr:hypothetical protein [Alistipes sp.]